MPDQPLALYRKKRNFSVTPEPQGHPARGKGGELSFAVQKHAASRLHYDFRLELNGVLLSWAVPKGPSLDPGDKRLAMHVEDHPLEYGGFEGVIPPKQYGSGTVLLWDRGAWVPKEDAAEGYRNGKLKFELQGDKLRGGWTLVRSRGSQYGGDKAWLLIKEDDEFARRAPQPPIVEEQPASVASGRSMEEIAADPDRVWHSNKSVADNVRTGAVRKSKRAPGLSPAKLIGAAKEPMPTLVVPELATLVKEPPAGTGWLLEMKFDGYRMLCRVEKSEARIYSRSGKDWTDKFAAAARAAARLPVESAWLDGELVVVEADGRSSFQALQNALSHADTGRMRYYLFDLVYLNGYDLRKSPLNERKRLLEQVLDKAPALLSYSTHVEGSARDFHDEACRMRLEGIIAKRADSAYVAGRGRSWLKVKCGRRQEMVIGGYTDPAGSRSGLGALLLGVYEADGTLRYSGKVGTGFNEESLQALRKKLDPLAQDKAPFSNPPRGAEARRSHWVKPQLVAEIAFTEWTDDGTLRHPSFQGLREDKKAREVIREQEQPLTRAEDAGRAEKNGRAEEAKREEKPAAAPRARRAAAKKAGAEDSGDTGNSGDTIAGITLSNPGKVLYPEAGLAKRDLAAFYAGIGEWIVPHLSQRPVTLVRCPNGWNKPCFFQKNADKGVHGAIERVAVETSDGPAQYMMANSTSAIVALVQMGALELHPWGAKAPRLGFADRVIFDFDPDDDLPWEKIVEAVRLVKTLLEELGLQCYVKTTGGKGLHVVVPVEPVVRWETIKEFTKTVAELLTRTFPDRFTAKITKSTRRGKIFIDYLRNAEGSTAIAAYSIRARANAPVATPIAWSELAQDVRFDHFTVRTVPERLRTLRKDPWAGFFTLRQQVTTEMMRKVGYEPPAREPSVRKRRR